MNMVRVCLEDVEKKIHQTRYLHHPPTFRVYQKMYGFKKLQNKMKPLKH